MRNTLLREALPEGTLEGHYYQGARHIWFGLAR
jgi:hypothetical protein